MSINVSAARVLIFFKLLLAPHVSDEINGKEGEERGGRGSSEPLPPLAPHPHAHALRHELTHPRRGGNKVPPPLVISGSDLVIAETTMPSFQVLKTPNLWRFFAGAQTKRGRLLPSSFCLLQMVGRNQNFRLEKTQRKTYNPFTQHS